MWNLKNKINKENRSRFINREQTDGFQRREGLGGMCDKVEGIKKYKLAVTK